MLKFSALTREAAKREQAEFLNRCGLGTEKALRWTMDPFMYHVRNLAISAREAAKQELRRFFEPTRFWERKGFEMYHVPMDHGPCWNLARYARSCEARASRISESTQFCARKSFG